MRECRIGVRDPNPITAPAEYVGHLEEIVELNYGLFRQVVFIGSWVKANYRGPSATVKRDQWGFTIANFERMVLFSRDSFALPLQVQLVFYCDCDELPGWKVVVRSEPRGKRVLGNVLDVEDGPLFRQGRDREFTGLQIPESIEEGSQAPPSSGRVIRMSEIHKDTAPALPDTFDTNLDASSEEE